MSDLHNPSNFLSDEDLKPKRPKQIVYNENVPEELLTKASS